MQLTSKLAFAVVALLVAAPVSAQQAQTPQWDNSVTFSPILALFEVLVADYERRVGTEATIGAGIGYWNFDQDDVDAEASYFAFDVKGRFYPDRAFKGFELGASLGVARIGFLDDETDEERDATGFTYGIEVGHGWLLGDTERWVLAVGIGAKRFWFDEDDDDLPTVMPTGRLSFGIAF